MFYRGYDIEREPGKPDRWVVKLNGERVHVANEEDSALSWIDAVRKKELEEREVKDE